MQGVKKKEERVSNFCRNKVHRTHSINNIYVVLRELGDIDKILFVRFWVILCGHQINKKKTQAIEVTKKDE